MITLINLNKLDMQSKKIVEIIDLSDDEPVPPKPAINAPVPIKNKEFIKELVKEPI